MRSTALLFGKSTPYWLYGFFGAALIAVECALRLASAPPIAHIGVLAAALHAWWQVRNFDDTDGERCLTLFRANRNFGLLILVGMIAGCFIR